MDIRGWNREIKSAKVSFSGSGTSRMFNVMDLKPNIVNCPSTIFKAIEEISVRLVLRNILYTNTIEGGIIFEDFVAMFYFSNTYVAQ